MLQHALDDIVATFPCSVIFSRLPVSISIVSSISTLSSRAVKAGAVVSFNSSSNSRLNQREFCNAHQLEPNRYGQSEIWTRPLTIEAALDICDQYGLSLDWLYRGDWSRLPHHLAIDIAPIDATERKH